MRGGGGGGGVGRGGGRKGGMVGGDAGELSVDLGVVSERGVRGDQGARGGGVGMKVEEGEEAMGEGGEETNGGWL